MDDVTINHITVEDIQAFRRTHSANDYQKIATKSAFYPGKMTHLGIAYCTLKLNGEAGELAEHVGKSWRDDHSLIPMVQEGDDYLVRTKQLTEERRLYIVKELGDCLWYISALCTEMNITLTQAMEYNLVKLYKRTQAGKLSGAGDDR